MKRNFKHLPGQPGEVDPNGAHLSKLLNAQYLRLTNLTPATGSLDLPALVCDPGVYPDFIALYSEPDQYRCTPTTAVGFYNYDSDFDGQDGLFNAIYYNNQKRLRKFKSRFAGVKMFISPLLLPGTRLILLRV